MLEDRSTFDTQVGPLFEGAPGFLARLAAERPFASPEAMFAQARTIAKSMPEAEQVELIDAHPRLGAAPGTVSAHSFREQGYDTSAPDALPAPDALSASDARSAPNALPAPDAGADSAMGGAHVAAELERLNDAYEARFGFRYCVFVAGRSRADLLPAMATALEVDRAAELSRALDAVIDIAADRYRRTADQEPR